MGAAAFQPFPPDLLCSGRTRRDREGRARATVQHKTGTIIALEQRQLWFIAGKDCFKYESCARAARPKNPRGSKEEVTVFAESRFKWLVLIWWPPCGHNPKAWFIAAGPHAEEGEFLSRGDGEEKLTLYHVNSLGGILVGATSSAIR